MLNYPQSDVYSKSEFQSLHCALKAVDSSVFSFLYS